MHTTCANVRRPSQFVCRVGSAHQQITKFQEYRCWFVRVRESWMRECGPATCRSVGVGHRSSPPISHVIRWSDKLTTLRKPQNSNDVDSKVERVAGELRAKLRWGGVIPEVSGCRGFLGAGGCWASEVAGCQGFWVPGIPKWQRFVSQSKLQADGPRRADRVSGPRTLRSVGHRHRMITILIHIHVRST